MGENYYFPEQLPAVVQRALQEGNQRFAEEYYALRILAKEGGVVLFPWMRANIQLKRLRLHPIFFGFADNENLETGCFGAVPEHFVIEALLDTYETENIYNQALLPLGERLRDFLMLHFGLRVNGRKQLLKKEIQICLPSVLSYDMKDGENCAKRWEYPVPEGYELVDGKVLKMWSDWILENWNLYKHQLQAVPERGKKNTPAFQPQAVVPQMQAELDRKIQEVVDTYENSTCWRITKPVRMLAKLFGKRGG